MLIPIHFILNLGAWPLLNVFFLFLIWLHQIEELFCSILIYRAETPMNTKYQMSSLLANWGPQAFYIHRTAKDLETSYLWYMTYWHHKWKWSSDFNYLNYIVFIHPWFLHQQTTVVRLLQHQQPLSLEMMSKQFTEISESGLVGGDGSQPISFATIITELIFIVPVKSWDQFIMNNGILRVESWTERCRDLMRGYRCGTQSGYSLDTVSTFNPRFCDEFANSIKVTSNRILCY